MALLHPQYFDKDDDRRLWEQALEKAQLMRNFYDTSPKPQSKYLCDSPTHRVHVVFIGGPLHLLEKDFPCSEFLADNPLHTFVPEFLFPVPIPLRISDPVSPIGYPSEKATYNLGVVPTNLTKFSDNPIILALYHSP